MNRLSLHHNVSILVVLWLLWGVLGLSSLVACSTEPSPQKETVAQEGMVQNDGPGGSGENVTTEATSDELVAVEESGQSNRIPISISRSIWISCCCMKFKSYHSSAKTFNAST